MNVVGRIDGKQYCELPEGHRTTFVVGMADMLNCLPAALVDYDPDGLKRKSDSLDRILQFMNTYESGDLRKLFDEYMREDVARQQYMIASNFLAMLINRSGAPPNKHVASLQTSLFHKLKGWIGPGSSK